MNAENNKNNNPWLDKFNDLVNTCHNELKRTTQIGMKMVSASQSNAQLQEEYQKLGKMLVKAIKSGTLTWKDEVVEQSLEKVEKLNAELKDYEKDVQNLKNE